MERFTPLRYTPSHTPSYCKRYGEFTFWLVYYTGYFIKEIENNFSRVYIQLYSYTCTCRNTRESLEELKIAWKYTHSVNLCSHFNFSFSQTSTRVSITVCKDGKCFLFLKIIQIQLHTCSWYLNFIRSLVNYNI